MENKIIDFVNQYKVNNYIYPQVISRQFNIPLKEVSIILENAVKQEIIERNYEIYCHICERHQGNIYKTMNEANEIVCAYCGDDIKNIDIILIYRKLDSRTS